MTLIYKDREIAKPKIGAVLYLEPDEDFEKVVEYRLNWVYNQKIKEFRNEHILTFPFSPSGARVFVIRTSRFENGVSVSNIYHFFSKRRFWVMSRELYSWEGLEGWKEREKYYWDDWYDWRDEDWEWQEEPSEDILAQEQMELSPRKRKTNKRKIRREGPYAACYRNSRIHHSVQQNSLY